MFLHWQNAIFFIPFAERNLGILAYFVNKNHERLVTMTTSIAPSNNKLVSMTPFQTQCILNLCIVNNIPADDLVSRGARASVAMVLTYFSQNTLVSTPEGLTFIPTKRHE